MNWILASLLAVAMVALTAALLLRRRDTRKVQDAAEQLAASADAGMPLSVEMGQGITAPLAQRLSPLLDKLAASQRMTRDQDRQLLRVLTNMREPVAVHGEHLVFINQPFASLLGDRKASELLGKPLAEYVPAEYADLLRAYLRRALTTESVPERLELELNPAAGQRARIELAQHRLEFQGRQVLLLSLMEMSPRAMTQAETARRPRSTAWETMDSLGEGIITTDNKGRVEYVNRTAEQLIGVTVSEALGREFAELVQLVDELDRHELADPVKQSLTTQARVSAGRRSLLVARGGEEHSVDLSVSPLKSPYGDQTGTVVLLRDVSELRGLTRQMSYQASHDALTGLVNRREFERRMQETLDSAHATTARHVLCYMDLDRFKAVNDTAGHLAGDALLREVAALIKDVVRDSDTVARLGGDEFGLILGGCPLEKATQIAEDAVRKVADYRFVWKDKVFTIGVSVGLVEISNESGTLEEVMSAADSACYVAKRHNGHFGNHVHVYSARDEAVARQRGEIQWLQRLQTALKENQFELMAQPIVAVSSLLRHTGPALEVLLRLHDDHLPEGIPPAEFLRAAERYRLMVEVDRWVVQTALTALGRGGIRLPEGRSLAINLSGQTLADTGFLEFVVECLDNTGVTPQQLCFEVAENAVMTNMEQARRFIGVLHGMGCSFALDDFGRGLSSFGNLKNLAIDYLKIDGSFIRNLGTDNVNQAMVSAMVKLSRTLNFQVIAEQVEDAASLDAARRMGVDFVQGFELARPQPLARVVMRAAS
jgi:diguanylate cyclase (GGDEF)-like protein/PAS domain S-box-containing protein